MNIENELEKLYTLRSDEKAQKEENNPESRKEVDKLEKKVSRLMDQKTKAGQERFGFVMEDAQAENYFREGVYGIVGRHNLEMDWKKYQDQMESDRRYISLPVKTLDDSQIVERFLKILKPNYRQDDYERDQSAFIREMQTMTFLKEGTSLATLEIKAGNDDPHNLLYNLTETLPAAEIGFIHSTEDMEKLTPEHAKLIIEQLEELNRLKLPDNIDEKITDLQDPFDSLEGYKENIWNLLSNQEEPECTQVRPLDGKKDEEGNIEPEVFIDVLARRFGFTGEEMQNKVDELFARWEKTVKRHDNGDWVMTHGDLSPGNMYVGDAEEIVADDSAAKGQRVRFLDWEWSGKTRNKLLSIVYDYGNLRARAWNNPQFQIALDKALKDHFNTTDDPEAGSAIVSLGTFRSHAMLAGFFENYEPDKQTDPQEQDRRRLTEEAIVLAFKEAGISFGKYNSNF